jgi:pyruvate dehydrogenase E1 component alpha subunit
LARDPIKQFERYMLANQLASAEELKAINQKIQNLVEDAVEFAEQSPEPDPSELHRYIFADE